MSSATCASLYDIERLLYRALAEIRDGIYELANSLDMIQRQIIEYDRAMTELRNNMEWLIKTVNALSSRIQNIEDRVSSVNNSVKTTADKLSNKVEEVKKHIVGTIEMYKQHVVNELSSTRGSILSALGSLETSMARLNKENYEKMVEKFAEVSGGVARVKAFLQRDLERLFQHVESIDKSLLQMAEGTLIAVRKELERYSELLTKHVGELNESFKTTSGLVMSSLNELRERIEEEEKYIDNTFKDFKKVLEATAYSTELSTAFVEAVRSDVNKTLDAVAVAVANCCALNYIKSS
ncbi:MAG: hypothetical protein QW680_09380 [Pyrobaculum sp.]